MENTTTPQEEREQKTLTDIEAWQYAKQQLVQFKTEEMRMRKGLISKHFDTPKEGVNNLKLSLLGEVAKFKFTNSMGRKVIPIQLSDGFLEALKYFNGDPDAANKFMESIVKLKPTLDVRAYKQIVDPELKRIADGFVETKPGSPVLTIELEG